MYCPNLKFVAFPVPEIIGGTHKNLGSTWIRPRSLCSKIFNEFLFGWTLLMYRPNLKPVASPFPEIIAIELLGGALHSNVSSIFTRFRDITANLCATPLFPTPPLVSPKISQCSPGSRWMAFGLPRAKVLG